MITFDCPKCGETLRYEDRYAGASAMCRKCGHAMTIPSPQREQALSDGLSTAIAELDPEFTRSSMIPRDYTAAAALMSTQRPHTVHARLGAGFWLTAFFFPPLAVLYGLRLHYDHPQKTLAVFAPLAWSIVPLLILLGGLSALSRSLGEARRGEEAARTAQQQESAAAPARNDAQLRDECVARLKEIGLALVAHAERDPQHLFPALSPAAGRLMFSHEVYPAFLPDLTVMIAPADSDAGPLMASGAINDPRLMVDDHSFLYLGYVALNDTEVDAFALRYRETLGAGRRMEGDLAMSVGAGSGGTDVLYALRSEAVDRINAARPEQPVSASAIPVLIERPEHYGAAGGHVLYLDGHVAFLSFPGPWPMTEKTVNTLLALDAM